MFASKSASLRVLVAMLFYIYPVKYVATFSFQAKHVREILVRKGLNKMAKLTRE